MFSARAGVASRRIGTIGHTRRSEAPGRARFDHFFFFASSAFRRASAAGMVSPIS